jgi:protein O-mannosyl-transferase
MAWRMHLDIEGRRGVREAGGLLLVLVLALIAFSTSWPKAFLNWDDPKYVLENPLIRDWSLETLGRIFTTPYFGNYAPLTLLSYALDIRLWGLDANAFHAHNLLLHLGAVVALHLLLGTLGMRGGARWLVLALFALHPTNVESVSWASERKNLLSSLFFLLSFWQYVQYAGGRARKSYAWALVFFVLSLLSKAGTVVAPLIFLAYDFWWKGRRGSELRLLDKVPFALLAGVHTALSIWAATTGDAFHSYHEGGPLLSLMTGGHLLGSYLILLLWPVGLTPLITPNLIPSWGDWRILVPFVLAAVAVTGIGLRWSGRSFFWVFYSIVLLVPVMNLVPLPVVMASRYLYLAQVGLWVLVATGLTRLWTRAAGHSRSLVAGGLVIWVLLLGVQSAVWARSWRSSVDLWEETLTRYPMNLVARVNLGQAYLQAGRNRDAAVEFMTVLMLQSDNVPSLTGLALYELGEGRVERAASLAARALELSPRSVMALRVLGRCRMLAGEHEEALEVLRRAQVVDPWNQALQAEINAADEQAGRARQ